MKLDVVPISPTVILLNLLPQSQPWEIKKKMKKIKAQANIWTLKSTLTANVILKVQREWKKSKIVMAKYLLEVKLTRHGQGLMISARYWSFPFFLLPKVYWACRYLLFQFDPHSVGEVSWYKPAEAFFEEDVTKKRKTKLKLIPV